MIKLGIIVLTSIVILSPLLMNEAFALINVTERMMDYEMTQIANYTYIHKFGLPQYIQNSTGDYVAYVHTEDANGVELETGQLTYYFDKSTCQMAIHSSGAMLPPPLVVDDNWILNVAVNGTESYSAVPQNDLACVVTTTYLGESATINSTKSDSDGTISEIYAFDPYKGLKHDLIFTNTNPSWNDHKFAWSNLMDDVPSTFAINIVDGVGDVFPQMYSLLSGASQPVEFNGDAIVLNYASSESIVYDVSDFIFNGTALVQGFNLYPPTASGNDRISYFFKDAIDKLSTVEFNSNPDQTIDVVVNYQNVTQPLAINSTINLDPTTTFSGLGDRSLSLSFGGSGFHCGRTSSGTADLTTVGVGAISQSGASISCVGTYAHFDITSIPDNATPTRLRLSINATSGSCSGTQCNFLNPIRIFEIYDEDISQFSFVQMANILSVPTDTTVCKGGFACVVDRTSIGNFGNTAIGQVFPTVRAVEATLATSKFIIDFEDQLESGKNFFDFLMCVSISIEGGGTNRGGCRASVGVPASNSNSIFWELVNPLTFFEVEFEIFTVPSAPTALTATFSDLPDTCLVDWGIVADDGGKPVTGYLIERNINGGSFTTLVASSPVSPTEHSDTTITTAESYLYRVSAINSEGTGTGATTTASCGIPSIADPPLLVNVFEQPTTEITLDWVLGYDGALPVLGYKIERSVNSGSFNVLVTSTVNTAVTFIDGTAGFNVFNTYRISTINSLGTSVPSNELGFTIVVAGGGGVGQPVGSPVAPITEDEDLLTQQEFDLALQLALSQIEIQELTIIETVVRTFFEFAVVDTTLDDLPLNSFLQNERLGIRWSSGQDIVVVSASPAVSPFQITFEQFPVVKQGSGAVVSTDFLVYNLQVPRNECTDVIRSNCALKVRYEVPITVNAILNGTSVSDTGTITVDLREGEIDPILLIILATFGIPIIGAIVQRGRKRSTQVPIGRLISG